MSDSSLKLNTDQIVLWFDDLGSGNEEYNFLSNFYEGEPFYLPGLYWHGTFNEVENPFKGSLPRVNFTEFSSPTEFMEHPVVFDTGEHAFQALKSKSPGRAADFYKVATAPGPSEAKALGRTLSLRQDWEVVKYDVMCAVVRQKYTLDREEGQRLLETGDKLLVEGTWWNDEVWGVDLTLEGLPGRNWLGSILQARRSELRAAKAFPDSKIVQHFVNSTSRHNAEFVNPH